MRCPRCGNENPAMNRFCGMCGTTLSPDAPPVAAPSSPVPIVPGARPLDRGVGPHAPSGRANATQRPSEPIPERTAEPVSGPIISGPSFLGLNQPGPARPGTSERSSQMETSSRSLDYLLEDEEPETRSGLGKFVLILIALTLALGLGYLRWKDQGLDWLTSGMKKPAESAQGDSSQQPVNSGGQNSATPNPGLVANGSTANAPASPGAANTTTPQPIAPSQPSAGAPTAAGNDGTVIPVDPDTHTPAPANVAADKASSANPPATDGSGAGSSDTAAGAKNGAGSKATENDNRNNEDAENSDSEDSAPAAKPAPALSKPHAAKPVDPVFDAEKYIYGRGVGQDCDHGLRILRPAANQANAKAMISLGALYSAGLCTPRDLPTAYRWFAMALRKEPDNNSVQTDLQKLWSEMTQPERQLAIKLSQ